MKSDISCVLVHKGYKPYLKYNLEITSKNNKIYLIGDKSLERLQNTLNSQIDQFNEQLDFNRNQFNTQNANLIEQSNVTILFDTLFTNVPSSNFVPPLFEFK